MPLGKLGSCRACGGELCERPDRVACLWCGRPDEGTPAPAAPAVEVSETPGVDAVVAPASLPAATSGYVRPRKR